MLQALRSDLGYDLRRDLAPVSLLAMGAFAMVAHPSITARQPDDYPEWMKNPSGEKFAYVLKGTLVIHSELYEPLVLDAGHSVYFDATMMRNVLKTNVPEARELLAWGLVAYIAGFAVIRQSGLISAFSSS